ncbi:MAG: cobalamin biosynthesis protein CobW [Oscillospiraceae bacterium]|jgi:G3E family GTPase|nr:cobalamin biosynthesis protein CobW [Oscillospiraceae bacterium]
MTKIDIISGFLGAGKTTLIKKLLAEALKGEKIVLIENEFGEIGIDGGFMKEAGIEISEMNSGCICCSLVGDFGRALHQVMDQFHPDRILIEPSGVGKLSDVLKAVEDVAAEEPDMVLGNAVTVADAAKCRLYMKNFGEFYNNQVEHAAAIVLSRTQKLDQAKLEETVALLREKNASAPIITTPWDQLTGGQILEAMDRRTAFTDALMAELEERRHEHHDHEHGHGPDCSCGCHDHDHEHHHDHEHDHHHNHDHDHHHDHHDHGPDCSCGCHDHDHDHHHHHHADEVFTSWGLETPRAFTQRQLEEALEALDEGGCGNILRAKGIVASADGGQWLHFDYVPGEHQVRQGGAETTGKLCVIGAELREDAIRRAFGL